MKVDMVALLGQLGIEVEDVEHMDLAGQLRHGVVEGGVILDAKGQSEAILRAPGTDKLKGRVHTHVLHSTREKERQQI